MALNRDRRSGSRSLVRGATSGTAVLLVAALVLMVNYLGWKYHQRFDWTEEQLYALSEKTRNVLAGLDQDVRAVVFMDPRDELYEPTREVLERYAAASPRLEVRYLDPVRNPLEAGTLAREHDLESAAVVFQGEGGSRVVSAVDLVEYDFSAYQGGGAADVAAFRGEQRFTRALLDLAGGEKPRALFTTGHGEISLDDRTPAGLGEAARILEDDNFELEEWASRGADRVPEGTDLVVVAGPTGTFLPPELDLLDRFLAAGGRMLVLLDPPLGDAAGVGSTGLEEWLEGYGVDAGANVVLDPENAYPFFGAETLYADRYPADHPATRAVRRDGLPVLVSLARSVGRGVDGPEDLALSVLVETSPGAWGETDLDDPERGPGDMGGPVPLAVVVEEPGGRAEETAGGGDGLRLVVFGDSTFATDQLLQANVGNAVLLIDTLNWLAEREDALGIPARRPEQVRLTLTVSQVRWIFLFVLLVLPGLAVVLGVFVHYRRRR